MARDHPLIDACGTARELVSKNMRRPDIHKEFLLCARCHATVFYNFASKERALVVTVVTAHEN